MARFEPEQNVTLSVLDRLIDTEPNSPADAPIGRSQSLRQLRTAIRRDLEWLLNTRRNPEAVTERSSELSKSLYNYGLPDLSNLGIHAIADQNRLLWMMEACLEVFEPRIMATRVVLEPVGTNTRILRFQIQGLLKIDPAPERVTFDTVLELTKGEYEVKPE